MTTYYGEFDTSFASRDREIRGRHGQVWTNADYEKLEQAAVNRWTLRRTAEILERKGDAVLTKMMRRGLITQDTYNFRYWYLVPPANQTGTDTETTPNPTTKDHTMTTNASITKVEQKTFINGVDAATLSDDHIFGLIAKAEQQIESLNKINNKPKKLQARIKDISAYVKDLVAYVDNR